MPSIRGSYQAIYPDTTIPGTGAVAMTAFKAEGNSVLLEVTTTTGGCVSLTFTAEATIDGSTYGAVIDRDSTWSMVVTTPHVAGVWIFPLEGLETSPASMVRLSYQANTAAGKIKVNALSWDNPAGGGAEVSIGDVVVDVAAIEVDVAALEVLQTSANALLTTIDADTSALVVDLAALEVLSTAANVDLAAMEVLLTTISADVAALVTDLAAVEALLITIDADTSAMVVDLAALEVLSTSANALLATIDADTSNIATDTAAMVTDLAAIETLITSGNAILTTIDTDTGAIATDIAAIETLITAGNAVLATIYIDTTAIAADTAAMVVDLAAMEVLITSLETLITAGNVDLDALETLVTAGNVDLAALEVLMTALETLVTAGNVDLDAIETLITAGNVDLAAIETLITSGNAILTTMDTDTGAMVVDLAAIEVLITAGNAILTTIDADTGAIKTAVEIIDDAIGEHDAASTGKGIRIQGRATAALSPAIDDGEDAQINTDLNQQIRLASHNIANGLDKVGEDDPISEHYSPVTVLFSDEAVVADPGASFAPDANGHALTFGHQAGIQLYLNGGTEGGPANTTVTVTIEASMGLLVAAAVRWIDVSKSVLDLNTGLSNVASWSSTGDNPTEYLLSLAGVPFTHFRVKYDWDTAPDNTDGAIVVNMFKSAL